MTSFIIIYYNRDAMAKRSKSTNQSIQEFHTLAKLEMYCKRTFGMSFMIKMEKRILQVRKEFTENILEHIKEAEKITGQDYLEIKE